MSRVSTVRFGNDHVNLLSPDVPLADAIVMAFHARSDAHERLQQLSEKTLQLDIALQRHETDAAHRRIHDWIMLDGLVGLVEVAGAIASELMTERAFEDAGPFRAGVAMPRQLCSRCRLQHEDAHALARSDLNGTPLHSTSDPTPRTDRIARQGLRNIARAAFAADHGRNNIERAERSHRALQGARRHRGRL